MNKSPQFICRKIKFFWKKKFQIFKVVYSFLYFILLREERREKQSFKKAAASPHALDGWVLLYSFPFSVKFSQKPNILSDPFCWFECSHSSSTGAPLCKIFLRRFFSFKLAVGASELVFWAWSGPSLLLTSLSWLVDQFQYNHSLGACMFVKMLHCCYAELLVLSIPWLRRIEFEFWSFYGRLT